MNLGLNLMQGPDGGGGTPPTPTVPKVNSSDILDAKRDGIVVKWDQAMVASGQIQNAINIIIDGAIPIHPKSVEFDHSDPSKMALIMNTPFTQGQVVTWSYNDQDPTEELKSAAGVEADNQTYGVTNHIVVTPVNNDWVDETGKPWTDGTDHWTYK